MGGRFTISMNGLCIKDLQSDWVCKLNDLDDVYFICDKLNSLDDEKWEYRKKFNNLRTKMHKIHKLSVCDY